MKSLYALASIAFLFPSCSNNATQETIAESKDTISIASNRVVPVVVTDTVQYDTDDPAIWYNAAHPDQSIVVGTDKDENGGLYSFDLQGHIRKDHIVAGLKRPNNVDIAHALPFGESTIDIAVVTERMTHKLRIFSLPDLTAVDNGGIEVFEGETQPGHRDLMGIALYTNPASKKIYAIVGRKTGSTTGEYLWQYELVSSGKQVKANLVRKFGKYSGKKEIESIAVDNELGYVYYSDEGSGVHKYYADPSKGNEELALFGTTGFTQDHEGISIYKMDDGTGYILVSDQQANRFNVFPREGSGNDPNSHPLIKSIDTSTMESDGSDVINVPLNGQFSKGLFVAMSTNKTFQYYRWEDIAGTDLKVVPQKIKSAQPVAQIK